MADKNIEDIYPLSPMQQGMLFESLFLPDVGVYNVVHAWPIGDVLDVGALRRAFQQLVERHPILRTTFLWEGLEEPLQVVQRQVELPFEEHDLRGAPDVEARVAAIRDAARATPFVLSRAPLLRIVVLRTDSGYQIVWVHHHLLLDGWSSSLVLDELAKLYEAAVAGRTLRLATPRPYRDFIGWLKQRDRAADVQFWRERLQGFSAPLRFAFDRGARKRPGAQRAVYDTFPMEPLEAFARSHGFTVSTVVHGAFALLLSRYARQRDVVIGSTVSGRPTTLRGVGAMVGLFIQTVPLRIDVPHDATAASWLARLQAAQAAAQEHAHVPLPEIQALTELEGGDRLFDAVVVFENFPVNVPPPPKDGVQETGHQATPVEGSVVAPQVNVPLLLLAEPGAAMTLGIIHDSERFEEETVRRLLQHLRMLLGEIIQKPNERLDRLAILGSEESHQLLVTWNETDAPCEGTFPTSFEERVKAHPSAPALLHDDRVLTYGELSRNADVLAERLRRNGVRRGDVVALLDERGFDLVTAIVAAFKAHAAYLPLDPRAPSKRIAQILSQSGCRTLLVGERFGTVDELLAELPTGVDLKIAPIAVGSDEGPARTIVPDTERQDLAYVIYTSGSTGRPKGAMIEHGGMQNHLLAKITALAIGANDIVAQTASQTFDISVWQMLAALMVGGRIRIYSDDVVLDPQRLLQEIEAHGITVVETVPSLLAEMLRVPNAGAAGLSRLRWMIPTGEALPPELCQKWLGRYPHAPLVNAYGPTECSDDVTQQFVREPLPEGAARVPIGPPIINTRMYVLDPTWSPVPIGLPGELYVGGLGVGRGYLADPARTAEAFVPDPFSSEPGARLYRTGDLARWLDDGSLDFLGRVDHQVKVRGFRIELGEIESVLLGHPDVEEAVAVVRDLQPSEPSVVAYMTLRAANDGAETVEGWRAVYDDIFSTPSSDPNSPSNLRAWVSSYSRQQLPSEHAFEILDETAARVLALRPASVLDVGCGNGLVLERVAPHCERYVGLDISAGALSAIRARLPSALVDRVGLHEGGATQLDDVLADDERFDVVLFSEVVQYFPDIAYLVKALECVRRRLRPGGTIVLAGIRNARLLRAFHTAIQLHRAPAQGGIEELRSQVDRSLANEREVVVDPSFFFAMAAHLGGIERVDTLLKLGKHRNELIDYRFDVVMSTTASPVTPIQWHDASFEPRPLEWFRERLPRGRECVGFQRIPNARLAGIVGVLGALEDGSAQDVESLHRLAESELRGPLPQEIAQLARERGLGVALSWRHADERGGFDAVVGPLGELPSLPPPSLRRRPWSDYTFRRGALSVDTQRFRAHLAERLPDYMVPAAFVVLDAMPRSASGKLDRAALPMPDADRRNDAAVTLPSTPIEEMLAGLWLRLLGGRTVDVHQSFFERGGHSLLATRLVSQIREAFGVDLPLRTVFEAPTIAGLAARVEKGMRTGGSQDEPIVRVARDGFAPASFSQQRLWLLDQIVAGSAEYNIPVALRLRGRFDDAFLSALNEIIRRHESLRTVFSVIDGELMQKILPRVVLAPVIEDLSAVAVAEQNEIIRHAYEEQARTPFDLSTGPLVRARLVRLGAEEHVLLLTLHHIVYDGWSTGVLVRELETLYRDLRAQRPFSLPELPIQYADFAVWQKAHLSGGRLDDQLRYWKEQMAGDLPTLTLPLDRPRPTSSSSHGGAVTRIVGRALADRVVDLGRAENATLFMVLFAAFNVVLSRYSGQTDISVGVPIANRNRTEIEGLVGFFVNTMVLRTRLEGAPSFRELLRRVRETSLGAYSHQDLPFEKLVEAIGPERTLQRNPLFQVMFILQNMDASRLTLDDVELEVLDLGAHTSKFDLTIILVETPEGLATALEYNADIFEAATAAGILTHFERVLEAAVGEPDRAIDAIALLSPAEQTDLLHHVSRGDRATRVQPETLHEAFRARVRSSPEAVALVEGSRRVTYRELDRESDAIARTLAGHGVGPEARIGIGMGRSVAFVAGLLGVLKAGGTCVPVDPKSPAGRNAAVLTDAGAALVLSDVRSAPRLQIPGVNVLCVDEPAGEGVSAAPADGSFGANAAYIIYTSGSTGRPKGIVLSHESILNRLQWMVGAYPFEAGDVAAHKTSPAFVDAITELFGPLLAGVPTVLVGDEASRDPARLTALVAEERITRMVLVPSLLAALLEQGEGAIAKLASVRTWISSGEALPIELAAAFRRQVPGARLLNLYGSSEVAGDATWFEVPAEGMPAVGSGGVPIGRPLAGMDVFILDGRMAPVPVGVPGELYVGGVGVARGYHGDPARTAERFVPSPWAQGSERLYRTGDRARWLPGHGIEYLGRADHQIKLRGVRIELGEIEACLRSHPQVRGAAAILREDRPGDLRICGYVEADVLPAAGGGDNPWEAIFDAAYLDGPPDVDPTFDVSGWNSSYTGRPIPAAEMEEWVDHAVRSVLAHRPRRVLEIGCGTGLLLYRIAPECEQYVGTDVSQVALARVSEQVALRKLPVSLRRQSADDFAGIAPRSFDAVVLNSVAQYFPDSEYLVRVLSLAIEAVADGGIIYVGDLRSRALAHAFRTGVQLFRAPPGLDRAALQMAIADMTAREKELLVDPGFFDALAQQCARIDGIDVEVQRGAAHNELTQYRYGVTLHVGQAGTPVDEADIRWLDWDAARLDVQAVRGLVSEASDAPSRYLGIRRIPNSRVQGDVDAADLLAGAEGPETADALRTVLRQPRAVRPVDPRALIDVAHALSYDVHIRPSEDMETGRVDAIFSPAGLAQPRCRPQLTASSPASFVSTPRPFVANGPLVQSLRRHLADRLPDAMVPSDILILDALPLTPSGKLDRRALPSPSASVDRADAPSIGPRDEVEVGLVQMWESLLGRGPLSVMDNFFALGGHSLLAVRMLERVRRAWQCDLPLSALFRAPTIESLAMLIRERGTGDGSASLVLIQEGAPEKPLFCAHPSGGNVVCYGALAQHLGPEQTLYAFQADGVYGGAPLPTIEAMASSYIAEMRRVQPEGPYRLGGWSLGAMIAWEMAQQLVAAGERVSLLALIEPPAARSQINPLFDDPDGDARLFLSIVGEHHGLRMDDLRGLSAKEQTRRVLEFAKEQHLLPPDFGDERAALLLDVARTNARAMQFYAPKPYPGHVTVLRATGVPLPEDAMDGPYGWLTLARRGDMHEVPGDHFTLMAPPNIAEIAHILAGSLAREPEVRMAGRRTESLQEVAP